MAARHPEPSTVRARGVRASRVVLAGFWTCGTCTRWRSGCRTCLQAVFEIRCDRNSELLSFCPAHTLGSTPSEMPDVQSLVACLSARAATELEASSRQATAGPQRAVQHVASRALVSSSSLVEIRSRLPANWHAQLTVLSLGHALLAGTGTGEQRETSNRDERSSKISALSNGTAERKLRARDCNL